ncbi:hypothetical protein [Peribacillus sp. NPDC097225]|uniref:hypothetical protein n=1 Tax=unclassified Peribacillus TaxID=2675266 RepID=UPI00381CAD33
MRKIVVGFLIVCLYCFPFVYFSMYQDFNNRSMLGYLLMIVTTSILAFFGKLYSNSIPIISGNTVSAIISFYFISEMAGNEHWGGYFKPLTPYQLLIFVALVNLIPQFFTMKLANIYKNKA